MAHSCEGDHDHDETPERGLMYSLYQQIDTINLTCLNETRDGSGKTIFKPWENRLDFSTYVESDVDEDLLFNIPFTSNIKLKGIIVIGGHLDSHPSKMKLFKNRPYMTFDDVNSKAEQEFELQKDNDGSLEYATKIVTFSSVYQLSIYFPSNFGAEKTRIYYIGLKGDYTKRHQHGVTICAYESRPNLADHKLSNENDVNYQIK